MSANDCNVMEAQPIDSALAQLPAEQLKRLHGYLDALLDANARINLTALRDRDEAMQRHIVESVRIAGEIPSASTLIDVGTGGGLPGMVIAITRPEIAVTLLEATEKKTRFLAEAVERLGLENVTVRCGRAEELASAGSELRENFDVVTARAVASLPTLLELTLPFARTGGVLIAVKGQRAEEEVQKSTRALTQLCGELQRTIRHPSATLLLIEKRGPCPARFPRRTGEPKRNPL